MYLGRIMGNATATIKHPSMKGTRLLLVMALQADGKTIEGDPILVIDQLGARKGELVVITSDGIGAREMLNDKQSPVRWSAIALPDQTTWGPAH
ncbi:MAG: EutN/CcmL family microcompartment protein [Pirellulales bacterium]|nr:EutN/CcmL family microcompartment protein [Pirellulales bacterium]